MSATAPEAPAEHHVARRDPDQRITVANALPFLIIHATLLALPFGGISWIAVAVAVALYWLRMFVITAFYHRYFSHRTFKTHRVTQFLFALLGTTCAQRGPVWWAAHHRDHHRNSEKQEDVHSPQHGFWWSHIGWFLTDQGKNTNWSAVPDWARYPELVWLEKYHLIGPVGLGAALFGLGEALAAWAPGLGTNGVQMFAWGFAVSTVVLYHCTFTINSLAHTHGSRRFATTDDSRNNLGLALITMGEGWHNNHHYYPGSTRQGFYWWEVDATWYVLRAMRALGLVWDTHPVPARVYQIADHHSAERER